jgi:putative transcriptional regulator
MYAIGLQPSLELQLDRRKLNHNIFEVLLEASRARRRARLQRLARLIGGAAAAPRSTPSDGVDVRAVRGLTGLSQAKFAELLGIELATLRNWEQGRRDPTGPARALLRAIHKDPVGVIRALSS